MRTVHTIAELRQALPEPGRAAFAPTMGSLHAGHLALVAQARALGAPVVASIFVNRLQFAPHEDFDRYPRTLAADAALLEAAGCDLLFAPDEAELYPAVQTYRVQPDPAIADILEGAFRPGFFVGVCTVVLKLLNCVQPAVALFGRKDYQQWRVVERMVQQFALPVDVRAVDTVRADDGLALSSRNAYLGAAERQEAVALRAALCTLADAAQRGGAAALATLEFAAAAQLAARGWRVDYLTVRRRRDLQTPRAEDMAAGGFVALGAAWLGATRLIDNVEC